ncbi:dethiobiotin synthase [Flavobacteriaceae bacterium F89]|uniref:ATP-dependent dethiobiotin synthetase BioD n=1 Tax=Cerina litoralis TaxID=2874477 RepID=A0AAE3EUS6_9FLAO|nr:dethiobiotin synthase [Cerina litoralis]MCG2460870.1 dethiobiotin synthase [Cerina litoralis]
MKQKFFVTGISTEVGKTMASAIITEAMEADYWKPIQAGDLDYSDSDKVAELISNKKTVIHKNSYALKNAMSPHAAAVLEGIFIDRNHIDEPETENHLVIEGAGGVLVPLNDEDTVLDLIMPDYHVIVVSRHYLGSINHSLLTIGWLTHKGYDVSILFSGSEQPFTESIIVNKTNVPVLGRIDEEPVFNKQIVKKYADMFRPTLLKM